MKCKDTFLLLIILCLSFAGMASTRASEPVIYPDDPVELKRQFIKPTYFPEHITKKPGHYTITDWDDVIDETWGMGRVKSQKLAIFDAYWSGVDQDFACFPSLPGYNPEFWDSLNTLYRTEIENGDPTYGVSKGRFVAIMNHLALALKETHTYVEHPLVNTNTSLGPGVPLFVIGGWGANDHFGAGLTPLPDSSLLVYKAVTSHPLGLVPGDIVLGYDGIPWKELYQQMLDTQLPLYEMWWWGCSESSYIHSMLMSAGMNWHLFDTINILKYNTGDTVHFSTSLLDGQEMELWCTEQMDIPGVPMPNIYAGERASFGIIEGTQIGYIYVWSWTGIVEQEFENAVNILMNDYETTGLIIDYRMNWGGFMHLGQKGFESLFNAYEPAYGGLERSNTYNHLELSSSDNFYFSYIYGAAESYYDKPIAVLVGPGALSAGDYNSLAMKLHPMTRFFGKSTAAAFNRPRWTNMVYNNEWGGRYAEVESYLQNDPDQHLTRIEFPVDEEVWLTPDNVAEGHDNVVDAAVDWINNLSGNLPEISFEPASLEISLEPGEVITQDLTISNNGTSHLFYSLTPKVDDYLRLANNNESTVIISSDNKQSSSLSAEGSSRNRSTPNQDDNPIIQGHGGPDNFGYTWVDSHQPYGPSFNWVDISGVGIPLNLGDDSYAGPFDLGFEFPFYDSSYSEIYICSNGYLKFESGHTYNLNRPIPYPYQPNNIIVPWWDNLNPADGGFIYFYEDAENDRFIVSFIEVPKYGGWSSGFVTFQAILYSDGQIEFNYLEMDLEINWFPPDLYTATIGIENASGTDGLEVLFNAGYFFDSLSVRITTDWLAVSPSSGHIASNGDEVAAVIFSTKNLPPGDYTGKVFLVSNDPDSHGPSIIPCTLTVTTTDVRDESILPVTFSLDQNYPNPFNSSTIINYSLPEQSNVVIDIFDLLGRKVESITDSDKPAGVHQVIWQADKASSGMYFYKIQAGDNSETRKMMLLK